MRNKNIYVLLILVLLSACKAPQILNQNEKIIELPENYAKDKLEANTININWKEYFEDENLIALVDTALKNNQDIKIALQNIEMAKSGVWATGGALRPTVSFNGTTSLRKFGLYTMDGAGNITTEITPNKLVPIHLPDFFAGFQATWELDIYKKLKNTNRAALNRLSASSAAKNYVITNIVNEIATAYYELLALDSEVNIIDEYIKIQENAFELVKVQKESAAANELAVKQFEAQLYNLQEMKYGLQQSIVENESKINFLLGRFPVTINRKTENIENFTIKEIMTGFPTNLLLNRPDLRQMEFELKAANLDIIVARTAFLPSFNIGGLIGLQAFRPDFLFTKPQSIVYGLLGGITAPLINKKAIEAEFKYTSANQQITLQTYNQKIIGAYIEVHNQLMLQQNLEKSYQLKSKESEVLNQSISISDELFRNSRATYLEVLAAQENALQTRISLVQIKKSQLQSRANIYKALGGGWK